MNVFARLRAFAAISCIGAFFILPVSAGWADDVTPAPSPSPSGLSNQIPGEALAKIPAEVVQSGMKRSSRNLGAWIDEAATQVGGDWMTSNLVAGITPARIVSALLVLVFVGLLTSFLLTIIRRRAGTIRMVADHGWLAMIITAVRKPLALLLWIYGFYFALELLIGTLHSSEIRDDLSGAATTLSYAGVVFCFFWLIFRLIHGTEIRMKSWAEGTGNRFDNVLVPIIGQALRLVVPLLGLFMLFEAIDLAPKLSWIADKLLGMLLIGGIAYLILRAAAVTEQTLLNENRIDVEDNLSARKLYTKVSVIRKIISVIVITIAVACVLMMFDSVRQFGTSILASAGIAGIVVGLAAQRTLGNLIAGIQIAISQPIRIDDVVIVEGEWGRIEELTLTYVVVRIWDLRRLVLPINYFIEKPFQNWTRNSADILGTVFLYADYTIPVDEVRNELQRIAAESPLWDRKVCGLVVTDATPQTLEMRCLVSTSDASKGWDLRCEVREKMLAFIQKNHPDSLPRVRAEMHPVKDVQT